VYRQCPLIEKKTYKWCEHTISGCIQMMNDLELDDAKVQKYCDDLRTQILPNYRYLLYIDHLTNFKDVSIDQLIFLRTCGLTHKEIADLFHCSVSAVALRIRKYDPVTTEQQDLTKALTDQILDVRIDNPIDALDSKWRQLSALRTSKNEDVKLKAIKLQVEIEEKIRFEKEKLISEDRLTRFIRTIEMKIIEADNWMRDEIGQANKYLESVDAIHRIPYQPISIRIKNAIESDSELFETRNALVGVTIDVTPEEDDD
jgi:predicted transcriptional regulator